MMKIASSIFILIAISGCSAHKQVVNKISQESVTTEISDLSKFIEHKWDNTYNFRHERIKLPTNYKELVWKTDFGDVLKGSKIDTISIKYLTYSDRLVSLTQTNKEKIHFRDIREFYGNPSLMSTDREGRTTGFNYLFNNIRYPNCSCSSNINNYLGANCSLLSFYFNEKGYLTQVYSSMFNP